MSARKYFRLSVFVLAMPMCSHAEEVADVSLYLFREGNPAPGAAFVVDGARRAVSNAFGAIHLQLPPGAHSARLEYEGELLKTWQFELAPQESLAIVATQGPVGSEVSLSFESSTGQARIADDSGEPAAAQVSQGEPGTLGGTVLSLQTGVPIAGAKVYVSGIRGAVETDAEGRFTLEVPPHMYSISVIHPDFSSQSLSRVTVAPSERVEHTFELTPSAVELGEVVVAAPYLEGSFSNLVQEKRNTSAVAEVIGADQMSKSGDSDAAGALKRVTGLTVVDGKYIYVRGLGERYSSTTLNGAGLPSPDPVRRVVPLDLFPAGVLGSVLIQKTYSPDMPGDFAGGVVQLRTRGIPPEKVRKLSVTTGGNTASTFEEGRTYEGGGTDFLGMDDGTREFPARLDALSNGGTSVLTGLTPEELEAAGESLPNNYATEKLVLPPDVGFSLNFADRNEAYMGNWGWGYNFSLSYKNEWRQSIEDKATYGLAGDGGLVLQDSYTLDKTENEIDLGAFLNLTTEIGNNHTLESTTLLSRNTTDSVVRADGYLEENDLYVRDTTLEWVERQLMTQQFSGEHSFFALNDLAMDWFASYSTARRYEPDTRFYRYELDEATQQYAFSERGQSNERTFEDLNDETSAYGFDFTLPVYDTLPVPTKLKFGYAYESKDRDSEFSRFRFLTDWYTNDIDDAILFDPNPEHILSAENIDADGYVLRNTTLPTDNYTAEQEVTASYLMGEFALTQKFKAMLGARVESATQEVTTFQLTNPDESTEAKLESTDTLPALTTTWAFADNQQLRFGYSHTVNRPDLKELSEAPYIEPDSRDVVIGNPDLERALVTNYDLRWEWYLTTFETMSVALFYKEFDKPIEQVVRLGAGGIQTFENAESATNYGVEFQARSWLSRMLGRSFSRWYVETNLAVIDSSVELGEAGSSLTNTERPLQGQSPWIVNLTLGYENLVSRTNAALLFNMYGERITSAGTKGLPDAYEQPAPLLDFVYSREVYEGNEDKIDMKLKLKNILDPTFETLRGDEVEKSSKKGISFTASLTYSWK